MACIDKKQIRKQLLSVFEGDDRIEKVIVFGSFIHSANPHDLDLAVFCDSSEDYLTLALLLRKQLRSISNIIPIDLVPISIPYDPAAEFIQEINKGEVVYEKRH